MTEQGFELWLKALKDAWENKDPHAAANLCAENVLWYETPFDKPFKNKHEVYKEWESLPSTQKDIIVSYEILSVNHQFGIAHWNAQFVRTPSEKKAHLDGIFKVSLDKNNLCTEFHQWWNSEE